jgi:predicted secreted protein
MNWFIGTAAYVIIWWVVIFMVLPFGVRRVDAPEPGHDAGAPQNPRLKLKVAVTTVVAALLWLALYWAVNTGLVNFRGPS